MAPCLVEKNGVNILDTVEIKSNTSAESDPHFGHKPTKEARGFRILVSPSSKRLACWEFVLLLPLGLEEQENRLMAKDICEWALERGDQYSIFEVTMDDAEKSDEISIMGFDPDDKETFYWIKPPLHMMN